MNSAPNPYQPPAFPPRSAQPPPFSPGAPKPGAIRVFGTLHTIFGSFGIFGVICLFFLPLLHDSMRRDPSHAVVLDVQEKYRGLISVCICLNAAVTALLMTAGWKLLKNGRQAVQWSNRFAWAAIAVQIFVTLTNIVYIGPATRAAYEKADILVSDFATSAAHYLFTGSFEVVYALLTLFFLNQPRVKAWFAAHPAQA